jgi:ABC-type multidrug transport system ATPase subunit
VNLKITLKDIGRRYNNEWIFRHINYTFESGKSYAILGHNGSGKSTFLKVLSSSLTPSSGELIYTDGDQVLGVETIYQQLSLAAPYVELIEEFTLNELIDFHF